MPTVFVVNDNRDRADTDSDLAPPREERHEITSTLLQQGEHPFHSRFVTREVLTQSDTSRVEIVDDEIGRAFIRKVNELDNETAKVEERSFHFLTEARHPHLVEAKGYFQGVVDNSAVSATLREYVNGDNLEDYVNKSIRNEKHPLPVEKAVQFAEQVLDALSYVHGRGFLYRDVKPSNIVIQPIKDGERLRMVDIDSLGKQKDLVGSSGSTMAVLSEGWQHPFGMSGRLASVNTDLFTVGTMLYFMLTGEKPTIEKDENEQYSLSSINCSNLEARLGSLSKKVKTPAIAGGPELYRTIKRLMTLKEEDKYDAAKDALDDLRQIATIIKNGYGSDQRDREFRIYRAPFYEEVLRKTLETTGVILAGGVKIFLGNPLRIGITAGLVAGGLTAWGVHSHLLDKSENRAVYSAPMTSTEDHVMVRAAAEIDDTVNKVNALYVALAGKAPNGKPNDVVLMKKVQELESEAKLIEERLALANGEIARYAGPILSLNNGGQLIEDAWSYSEYTHTHQEAYDCSTTDSKGKVHQQTCHRTVCDSEDHTFTVDHNQLMRGAESLQQGVTSFRVMPHRQVPISKYVTKEAPEKDVIGRPVKDAARFRVEQDEWLNTPIITQYNLLAVAESVSGSRDVQEVLAAAQSPHGFGGLNGWDSVTIYHAPCYSSRSYRAPSGYITADDVHSVTDKFVEHYSQVMRVLNESPEILTKLEQDLQTVDALLAKGKKVDANAFMDTADEATYLYKAMVPYTTVAPPTAGERTWYPIFWGGLCLLVSAGIGFAMERNRDSYSSRRRYY